MARGASETGRARSIARAVAGWLGFCGAALGAGGAAWAQPDVWAQAGEAELRLRLPETETAARPRNVGRAALETFGVLLGGAVWYWNDLEFNSRDWDLKWDWPSWKSKLTFETLRFDQNYFGTNAGSHARAGLAHYHIARGNGLGVGASLATTISTSVLWEYLIEFKEMPSLNDVIVNTTAGFSIGEPLYQLGEYFLESEPTWLNRTVAAVISPVAFFNDWIDGRRRPRRLGDALGLSRAKPHRFYLGGGFETRSFGGQTNALHTGLGAGAALVTLPGYGGPGAFSLWAKPGALNEITADLSFANRRIAGGAFHSATTLAGHYAQDFDWTAEGLVGHGVFVGLGSSFDYEDVGRPDGSDYLASMGIAGPIFQLIASYNDWRVRWRGEAYGDFALVHSMAMAGHVTPIGEGIYRPAEHGTSLPSVLGARGYYYAFGLTAATEVALSYQAFEAGAEVRGDRFDSIEGFDRFREQLARETELEDQRTIGRAWVGVRPWDKGLRLSTAFEWRARRSRADALGAAYVDKRLGMGVSVVF
jgi:Domain of unknown function (DUF3943)